MITDRQSSERIEAAARQMCKLAGENADHLVPYEVSSDGSLMRRDQSEQSMPYWQWRYGRSAEAIILAADQAAPAVAVPELQQEQVKPLANEKHYLVAILIRLNTLYELTEAPNIREQLSDEIDWLEEKIGKAAPSPLDAIAATEEIARLRAALEKSVELQSHYAKLLNAYDGGQRMQFADANAWIERLLALGYRKPGEGEGGATPPPSRL